MNKMIHRVDVSLGFFFPHVESVFKMVKIGARERAQRKGICLG